jgi:hypothetical protein
MATVPARKREPRAQRPYVVSSCSKSAGSILASNKLLRSAPKRVAVRVNGGLGGAASDTKVSDSVSLETIAGVSACALVQRCMTGLDPERRLNVVRRSSHHAERRSTCGGRGTGAPKATGSYEGSLSVEGTSGRHEPSAFTSRWSRRPWRLPRKRERRQRCQRQGL